ncbi:NAD(+) kinase [Methylomonas montana]|uniref:NAD(+) kinase n=1 Tax=Methylomonas montana TaxID=3058963 RepID=UPI00265B5EBA|nr:NAD(+) kinase [Methylomonas montana]WKJ91944.1 NAD(+) kinase [Methylomonas montana]
MPTPFQRIGIIGKFGDPGIASTLNELYHYLQNRGHGLAVDSQSAGLIDDSEVVGVHIERLPEHCDLIIAVGGDGTFLAAARAAADFEIPLLGVNLGRLGFLVDISPEQLSSRLDQILAGQFKTEQRQRLRTVIIRDGEIIHQQTAVNEVVVHRWVTPSMIEIVTSIDGVYLNTQRSDGLIVATPTGSTAYSLSAGGPILHPALNALVLVPLNPHTLSNRPIVIDDNVEIEIRFSQIRQINALVTCDHLEIPDVRINDKIVIKKSDKPIKILHPADHDFFHTLRSKLNWSGYPA